MIYNFVDFIGHDGNDYVVAERRRTSSSAIRHQRQWFADAGDVAYAQFAVWRDRDSDAVVDPGELQSLQTIGLVALSLEGYRTGDKMKPKENYIYATTNAILGDRTIDVADVILAYNDRQVAPASPLEALGSSPIAIV